MTATTPQPITLEAREARRQYHHDQAIRNAAKNEISFTCQHPDPTAHGTCAGLKAVGRLGCLCPCHDKDAQ